MLKEVVPRELTEAGSKVDEPTEYLCAQQWLQADGVLLGDPSPQIGAPRMDLSKLEGSGVRPLVRRAIARALNDLFHTRATMNSPWRAAWSAIRKTANAPPPERALLSLVKGVQQANRALSERVPDDKKAGADALAAELAEISLEAERLADRRANLLRTADSSADLIIEAGIAGAQRRDDRSLLVVLLDDRGLPPLISAAIIGDLAHQGIAVDVDHPDMTSVRRKVMDTARRAGKKADAFVKRTK